jgi:hypothetical protein
VTGVTRGELLAFAVGYACGRGDEQRAEAAYWHAIYVVTKPLLDVDRAALEARRRPPTSRCVWCDDKSSCCVYLANLERNGARQGAA